MKPKRVQGKLDREPTDLTPRLRCPSNPLSLRISIILILFFSLELLELLELAVICCIPPSSMMTTLLRGIYLEDGRE